MTVEFIGMIHHRQGSEILSPGEIMFDHDYIEQFARAADSGGFDRVLIGYFSDAPDGFLVAAHAASVTKKLGFLLAHRPGFISPTVAARKFATLDQLTRGRLAMHVITGGHDEEQRKDGDFLDKDARYDRTDEYVDILKKIWTGVAPVTHKGKYYHFENASCAVKSVQQPRIPIYFGGASDAAIAVSAKHADVYALWGETLDQVREITGRIRSEAAKHGRTIRFSLSFRPILAPTEAQAWARAEDIRRRIADLRAKTGTKTRAPVNEGTKRLLAAVARGERLDKRLWTGAAAVTGAPNNSTALVGTPEQVADALMDYYDLGVTTFLIRGFDPLDDMIEYGRSLLPITKQMIAERAKARTAA